jgi:hypothetical protein
MKCHVVCHRCTFEGVAPSREFAEKAVEAHNRKDDRCSAEFEVVAGA